MASLSFHHNVRHTHTSLWDKYLEERIHTHTIFTLTYGLSSKILTKGPLQRAAPEVNSRPQTAQPHCSPLPTPTPQRAHPCSVLSTELERNKGRTVRGQGAILPAVLRAERSNSDPLPRFPSAGGKAHTPRPSAVLWLLCETISVSRGIRKRLEKRYLALY